MRKIFISYGDGNFKKSLKRIGQEAKQLGLFDKIILYSPTDLPLYITSSPLMAYSRGGGYWLWKPYIIWKTLQSYGKDVVVVYADAGCQLLESNEWNNYFKRIKEFDTIVFRYRSGFDYGWMNEFNCDSPSIKHWSKKNVLLYFDKLFNNEDWRENNKIWGGVVIAKNKGNQLIQQWLNLTLLYPELIIDPIGNELEEQYDFFSTHRHDQSILTPLCYYYEREKNTVKVLDETMESGIFLLQNSPILATRLKDNRVVVISLKTRVIRGIKAIIGQKMYSIIHHLLFE